MKDLPRHWCSQGDRIFKRADGVVVEISLEGARGPFQQRRIGWQVKLPVQARPNGFDYDTHFLPGDLFTSVGEVLKKVDQEWGPPDHIKAIMPTDWLGCDLERIAREAPVVNP